MRTILKIDKITKDFESVTALKDVSFELETGSIHCLVGENGAGKSTLIRILSGAISPSSGLIYFEDEIYKRLTPAMARNLGTETIYQENIVCQDMSVMENVFLGVEQRKGIFLNKKKMLEEISRVINRLNVDIDPFSMVRVLSPAQQKVVQIIKALVKKARILILDEPTAALSKKEIDILLEILLKIKEDGTGIIYISHHLDEVFKIADKITVLKDGEIVAVHQKGEYNSDMLITEMTGRPPKVFFKKQRHHVSDNVLEVRGYSKKGVVNNISFTLKKGEVLGFAGIVGSGRSEMARLIYGADRKNAGRLFLNGKEIHIKNPINAIRNGICLLPEDRKRDAIVNYQSVLDNVVISDINKKRRFFRRIRDEKNKCEKFVDLLKIKTPSTANTINNLSGGNQQKVIISRWLLADCQIFIFDEPTRGIDVGAKEEIYRLISDLAEDGKSIIMISSDLPELIAMSDRVMIMRNGEIAGEVSGDEINEKKILSYSIGGTEI